MRPDINQGVDRHKHGGNEEEQGAGDQGLMFGFACRETESLMPLPIDLSHKLVKRQAEIRQAEAIPHLRPDAKSQVTVEYDGGRPTAVRTVVLSTQHNWHRLLTVGRDPLLISLRSETPLGRMV